MITITINQVLAERDKTLYWLAKESGLDYRSLLRLSKNITTKISFDFIEAICLTLDCSPNDIFKVEK